MKNTEQKGTERTDGEIIYRLLVMDVLERNAYYGLFHDFKGMIPYGETERIYSKWRFYLAIPYDWSMGTQFTETVRDRIYRVLFGELWKSDNRRNGESFFVKTSEGERLFEIFPDQLEPEPLCSHGNGEYFFIFQNDHSHRAVSPADFNDFISKEKIISRKIPLYQLRK